MQELYQPQYSTHQPVSNQSCKLFGSNSLVEDLKVTIQGEGECCGGGKTEEGYAALIPVCFYFKDLRGILILPTP